MKCFYRDKRQYSLNKKYHRKRYTGGRTHKTHKIVLSERYIEKYRVILTLTGTRRKDYQNVWMENEYIMCKECFSGGDKNEIKLLQKNQSLYNSGALFFKKTIMQTSENTGTTEKSSKKIIFIILGICIAYLIIGTYSFYGKMVTLDEELKSYDAQIANMYDRRAELIPMIAQVVDAAALYE